MNPISIISLKQFETLRFNTKIRHIFTGYEKL